MTWGEENPDPHFKIEVSRGVFRCAVPNCTEHIYLSVVKAIPCRFEGGSYHGHYEKIIDPPESIVRGGETYVMGYYEDGKPVETGITVLVYSLQWSPDDDGINYATT